LICFFRWGLGRLRSPSLFDPFLFPPKKGSFERPNPRPFCFHLGLCSVLLQLFLFPLSPPLGPPKFSFSRPTLRGCCVAARVVSQAWGFPFFAVIVDFPLCAGAGPFGNSVETSRCPSKCFPHTPQVSCAVLHTISWPSRVFCKGAAFFFSSCSPCLMFSNRFLVFLLHFLSPP